MYFSLLYLFRAFSCSCLAEDIGIKLGSCSDRCPCTIVSEKAEAIGGLMLSLWSTRSNQIWYHLIPYHRIKYLHCPLPSPSPLAPKHCLHTLHCTFPDLEQGFLGTHIVTMLLLALRSSKIPLSSLQKCSIRCMEAVNCTFFLQINPGLIMHC